MVHSFSLHDFLKEHADTIFNLVKCYGFKSVTPIKTQIDPCADFVTWMFYAVDKEISKEVTLRARYYFKPAGLLVIDTYRPKENSDMYIFNEVDTFRGVNLA